MTIDSDRFDFVASDNCFDLSKGDEKVIAVRKDDITKDGKPFEVQVSDFRSLNILNAFDIPSP